MNAISCVLHCDGCTDRATYFRNVLLLAGGKTAIDLLVMPLRPDLFTTWSWGAAWINPFTLINPWLNGEVPLLVCATTFAFFAALVWNSVHRARHARINHWVGLLTALPFVNLLVVAALLILPQGKRPSVFDLPVR